MPRISASDAFCKKGTNAKFDTEDLNADSQTALSSGSPHFRQLHNGSTPKSFSSDTNKATLGLGGLRAILDDEKSWRSLSISDKVKHG